MPVRPRSVYTAHSYNQVMWSDRHFKKYSCSLGFFKYYDELERGYIFLEDVLKWALFSLAFIGVSGVMSKCIPITYVQLACAEWLKKKYWLIISVKPRCIIVRTESRPRCFCNPCLNYVINLTAITVTFSHKYFFIRGYRTACFLRLYLTVTFFWHNQMPMSWERCECNFLTG